MIRGNISFVREILRGTQIRRRKIRTTFQVNGNYAYKQNPIFSFSEKAIIGINSSMKY
jgi:hypothetical protein